jgi:ubiquinone/menaquinone biosynthesis C-methylase UbiE
MPLPRFAAAILLSIPLLAWQDPGVDPVSGRHIAPVMSASGAAWLDRPERAAEEQPDKAIDALQLTPGMTVADIGAGTGYMTLRMARRVGPTGKVYGVDIQQIMIDRLTANARRAGLTNVEPVLGTSADPRLPAGRIDLALMVDVYHELSQPQAMLDALHRALKPSGRLVLLEYRKEDPSIPIRPEHEMTVAQARQELEASGFLLSQVIETLPRQHILIFRPSPVPAQR